MADVGSNPAAPIAAESPTGEGDGSYPSSSRFDSDLRDFAQGRGTGAAVLEIHPRDERLVQRVERPTQNCEWVVTAPLAELQSVRPSSSTAAGYEVTLHLEGTVEWPVLWALLATSCKCDEARVSAVASADVDLVTAVLDQFLAVSAPVRICSVEVDDKVRAPAFGKRDRVVAGYYNATTKVIHVDSAPPEMDLRTVLWHELCHAVDTQNNLSKRFGPWFLDPTSTLHDDLPRRVLDEEAFALWCELGLDTLALSERNEAQAVLRHAFPRYVPEIVPVERHREATWVPPDSALITESTFFPRDDGVVEVALAWPYGPWGELAAVDLSTCNEVEATA